MEENKTAGPAALLPVLPLKNLVALPKSIIPVVVGRDISIKAVEQALSSDKEVFVTAQKSVDIENPEGQDLFTIGTRGVILQSSRMPNGTLKIFVEGIIRCRVQKFVEQEGYLCALTEDIISEEPKKRSELAAVWRNLLALFKEYAELNEKVSTDILSLFKGPDDLDYLTDTIAVQINLDLPERQMLLEMSDVIERGLKICIILKREIEILEAERSVKRRVASQVEKHQRDYYLNEQMRAIQRELGREDYQKEIQDLRKLAKKNKLSAEAFEKVEAELTRLEQMAPTSPEASVSRNYIDWLISVPWHKESADTISLEEAETLLNKSHASMTKVKDRVIEFLASKKFAGNNLKRAPIICLAGPPGVGKTSLAQAIAQALGRVMIRISLGGMRDEAEIRGHRRTYIGAMPGKLIQSMKKAKVKNPVIVLDEIDKMSMDFRGDPASALLEVLDPEQNKAFSDYFLEVEYDLSKVLFITTANVTDNIPYPLLDRMEVIQLSGYTDHEKLDIAQRFLLPKLMQEYALEKKQVTVDESILKKVIEEYTKEAGVRQLERIIAKLLRKSIQLLLEQKGKKKTAITVTAEMVEKWLGPALHKKDDLVRTQGVGIAHGLAWTEVGGEILDIEVTILKGKGALTLTGQLGEVMQESAQAAMSYVRSRFKELGLKENFYADIDVHIHLPEGAIPKDGPSAGITMVTALVSALTGIPTDPSVAMTGEVTLRGRVFAIGGLKEKLLAAIRSNFTKVIVPKANAKDVKEIEKELALPLSIVYVTSVDEVIKEALTKQPQQAEKKKRAEKKASPAKNKASNKPDKTGKKGSKSSVKSSIKKK